MDVRVGLWRKLSAKELMLLNCGVGEDSWGSLDCKGVQPVHSKGDQSWVFIGRTDAEAETSIFWPPHEKSWLIGKDPDAGRDWGQEEKGTTEDDGWMASPTQCTWVWVNSGSWWWTGRPGVLWFMGLQRVGHNWATELNWMRIHERVKKACPEILWCLMTSYWTKLILWLWLPRELACLLLPRISIFLFSLHSPDQ